MSDGYYGQNGAYDQLNDHNSIAFMIAQQIRAVNTATICKVVKCTNKGEVKAIGRVDVLPLVDMQDGIGRTSHHVNVQNVPYLRMQGGSKAIIMDPKPGDLALVVFADRDVSAVKKNKAQSAPGSKRHHNMADGMYVGTLLADAPTSYVRFDDDGTIYISPDNGTTLVTVKANEVDVKVGSAFFTARPTIISGRIGNNMFVASNTGSKIKAGVDFLAVVSGSVLCSQVPVVGADPVPDGPTS